MRRTILGPKSRRTHCPSAVYKPTNQQQNSRRSIVYTLWKDFPFFMFARSMRWFFGIFERNNHMVWLRHWKSGGWSHHDWQLWWRFLLLGLQFLLPRMCAFALVRWRQFGLYIGQELHISLVHYRFQCLQKHRVVPRLGIVMVGNDFFGMASDGINVGSGIEILQGRIFQSL